jgi:carbamate kinase
MDETGEIYVKENANKGWRKVVPSPAPISILEHPAIEALVNSGHAVICGGGGGVPVIYRRGKYIGVEGVIDKDLAAQQLAEEINADVLLLLTDVDHAYIHFNTPDEQPLHVVGTREVEQFTKEGHFTPGSMLPKLRAGSNFTASGSGRISIITSPHKAAAALRGKAGTRIVKQAVRQGEDSFVSI